MAMTNRHLVSATTCPYCGKFLDDATSIENQANRPKPNDLSVCISCGGYLVFDKLLKPIQLHDSDFEELPEEIRAAMRKYRKAILEMRRTDK